VADVERTVRTISTDEELAEYLRGTFTAFLGKRRIEPEFVSFARERFDLDRTWAAFDGAVQCGSSRTFPSGLRLPGLGSVPVSCLTNITVLPTHTRRGHLNRIMRAHLEAAVDAGEVASLLVAAEWPIYGRYGYGPATEFADWEIDSLQADVLGEPTGSCELVDVEDLHLAAADVLVRRQATTPGAIERPDWLHESATGLRTRPWSPVDDTMTWVLHRDAGGEVDGAAVYTTKEIWEGMRPASTIAVGDLVAASPVAERELWRYLTGIDLVTSITWTGDAGSVLSSVLRDARAARQVGRWDHVWARILDVPACLAARAYDRSDRIVVEVVDLFLERGGRFALETGSDGAACEPTTDAADVVLPVSALSASWLGGTDLRLLAAAGGIDEERAGAVDRLGALLRWNQAPYVGSDF
jgi:predicted acetyltransferase